MTISTISQLYKVNAQGLKQIILENEIAHENYYGELDIPDDLVEFVLELYAARYDGSHVFDEMILTTTPQIDGMHVLRHFGLCFGEVIFRANLLDRFLAALDDFESSLSLSSHELTGTSSLLEEARRHAVEKMKKDAEQRGANAIIGIDSETSHIGGGYTHVSICGTAVYVVPNDEQKTEPSK